MTSQELIDLKELSRSYGGFESEGYSTCGVLKLHTTVASLIGISYTQSSNNTIITSVPLEAVKSFKITHGPVRLDVAYTENPKDEHYCNALIKADLTLEYEGKVYEVKDATFKYRKNQFVVYPSHLSALNVLKELKPWNIQLDKSILENYTEDDVILTKVGFYEDVGLDLEFRIGEPGYRMNIHPDLDILEYFEKVSIEKIPYEVTDGEFTHRMIARIKYGKGDKKVEYENNELPIFLNMPKE